MKKDWIRVLACVLTGAVGWFWAFGWSPLIWLGVLVGFLVGRTWVGLTAPRSSAVSLGPFASSPLWGLGLVFLGWGGAAALAFLANFIGMFGPDGSGLLFGLIFLPLVSLCGLLGGPTAGAVARRTLEQVEAGTRPASDRSRARLALRLSRLTTAALLGFLLWVSLQILG